MALNDSRLCGALPGSADCPRGVYPQRSRSTPQLCAFFGAFAIFGIVGTVTSFLCFLPGIVCKSVSARRVGQSIIRGLFQFFLWYLERCGLVMVEAGELAPLSKARGAILVANHPSYLDAVIITAKVPNVCCIMKSSLVGHPVLAGQARLAGYVDNRAGSGLIKTCIRRIQEGSNMLIFPEGTRSTGALGPCKHGFALLARLTQRPVQSVIVQVMPSGFLGKSTPFFRIPEFPVRYHLRLGDLFSILPGGDAKSLGKTVENYFRAEVKAITPA